MKDTKNHISEFDKYLIKQVIQATEIEIASMIEDVHWFLEEALNLTATTFRIEMEVPLGYKNKKNKIISTILEHIHCLNAIIKHMFYIDNIDFLEFYKEVHHPCEFPVNHKGRMTLRTTILNAGNKTSRK